MTQDQDFIEPVESDVLKRRAAVKKRFQKLLTDANSYNPFLKDQDILKLKKYENYLVVFIRGYQEEKAYKTDIVANGPSEENLDLLFCDFQKPYEESQGKDVVHALSFTEYADIECGFINLKELNVAEAVSLNAGFEQIKTIMNTNNIGI